jgi:hypothetical protein
MDDVTTTATETVAETRTRPRWATCIHNFGDDLRWACSGWCGFPRPVRRSAAAVLTAASGWVVGADELIAGLVEAIQS